MKNLKGEISLKKNQQRPFLDPIDLYSSLQIFFKKKGGEETLPVATDGHQHRWFYNNIGKKCLHIIVHVQVHTKSNHQDCNNMHTCNFVGSLIWCTAKCTVILVNTCIISLSILPGKTDSQLERQTENHTGGQSVRQTISLSVSHWSKTFQLFIRISRFSDWIKSFRVLRFTSVQSASLRTLPEY